MSESQPVLSPVRESHRFDEAALQCYLRDKLPGVGEGLSIQQFQGGQSNPTFLLTTPAGRYVLRKKPPGKLLPSAHQVEREYQVMRALQDSGVPVPVTRLLCEESEIIGTPFYVMDHVEGRVLEMPDLAGLSTTARGGVYASMLETLADLHCVDWQQAGLSSFGKAENYYSRQIHRWSTQYRASCDRPAGGAEGAAAMQRLMEWLPENIPDDAATSIAHGDYRIGNLILHPDEAKVVAVLDWELATLGHPLADLAYCCIPYHLPHGHNGIKGLQGLDLEAAGIPSEAAMIEEYCRRVGRRGIQHWNFYLAFSLFRLAAILQGVFSRALQGNASSDNARQVGERAGLLAVTAYQLAQDG
ncbi:phosphotransferase [Halomonas eurihalina]|uniref:Phosphotransferase n=1 Tax=Halomonas eurihalina TaxID=42566 RepID=A0A5D9D6Q2_HALER|nr:phosphotransferase [Halomonas eurihalina]MDR5858814.1 phosphotransferase [Halomonas eurihalina]TZG38952.1 phosphotransferase [Halomonas eurihalina]